jgi:hypothetical protein
LLTHQHRITEKADVFSFGVVLYELLSRSLLLAWRLTPPPPPAANGGGSSHAADRSASRSGRWAAAAAAQLQHRGGGAEAAAMLAYARRVSDGYRAPRPPFWPPQIRGLVDACCAQEPHERPRMEEVLEALREICGDERVISDLNSYIHKDVGFVPLWAEGVLDVAAVEDKGGSGSGGAAAAGAGVAKQQAPPPAGRPAKAAAAAAAAGPRGASQSCGCVVS